jgi:cation/acetate symporter
MATYWRRNLSIALTVSPLTPPPPAAVQALVETIRVPRGARAAREIQA